MHNIAQVFIGMSQWEEAIVSLEYIMTEQPKHRAGLHLVVCCRALEDTERMKNAFTMLLAVPLNPEDEEKYDPDQVYYLFTQTLKIFCSLHILLSFSKRIQKML